ncbi:hypothetical protein POM88_017103 [Heracleum sosnowskyi]|uniref:Uncharacterized protein n=1 Tax=Heracleum sosnowskyi TaxID=360622 RepID=A0AAD8INJ1_9APIA|nr:hypothetical protein POM88_017103 [Heracleum sosnowskyi]
MRRLGSSSLLPLDLEIEKTARKNKKKAREARNQSSIMADQNDPPILMLKGDCVLRTQMVSQFEALNKKLESFSVDRHQPIHPAHQVQNVFIFCDMCGEGHPTQQCPLIYHDGARSSTVNYNQRPHEMEKKPTTEDLLLQYMQKIDALIQSQSASMRALEMQVGSLASAINNRPQGSLPSDTEPNPKNDKREHCKSITLRSGKEIEGDDDVHMMTHHNMDALELSLQEEGLIL